MLISYDVTGEETPTSGTAFVFGKDIVESPKAIRQHVCRQFIDFTNLTESIE